MKGFVYLITFIVLAMVIVSPIVGAILLAIKGIAGWGWFLFVSVVFALIIDFPEQEG